MTPCLDATGRFRHSPSPPILAMSHLPIRLISVTSSHVLTLFYFHACALLLLYDPQRPDRRTMAPLIHPGHLGLRSLDALGHHDRPDVDLDPVARFVLVFCVSFLVITTLLVLLKLLGVCLLACLIGCRAGPEERVVYRVSADELASCRSQRARRDQLRAEAARDGLLVAWRASPPLVLHHGMMSSVCAQI